MKFILLSEFDIDFINQFIYKNQLKELYLKIFSAMHAPCHNLSSKQSSIKILFGQPIQNTSAPISIDIQLGIFSKKHENIGFNLKQMLEIKMEQGSFIIQLQAKNGYGDNLAHEINSYLNKNTKYQSLKVKQKLKAQALSKDSKCYLLINSHELSSPFQKICSHIQSTSQSHQQQTIHLSLLSLSSAKQLNHLLQVQGGMRAAFNSLQIKLSFVKTPTIEEVLGLLFKEIGMDKIEGPLKAFGNLDLQLTFASSEVFDKYQHLRVFAQVQQKIQVSFFDVIKGLYNDQAKVYYFNQVFSMIGSINGQDFQQIIDAFFQNVSKSE